MGTVPTSFRKRLTGAARWFSEHYLGGPTRKVSSTPIVQSSATQIVGISPDRVNLVIINQGAFDVSVTPFANGSPTTGIRLGATGGNMTLTIQEDFDLVSQEWWGISVGGAVQMYALESLSDVNIPPEELAT